MKFETLEASVVAILGAAAAGRFQVVGYAQRGVAAEEIKNSLRTVQVFFSGGKFPKSAGSPSIRQLVSATSGGVTSDAAP